MTRYELQLHPKSNEKINEYVVLMMDKSNQKPEGYQAGNMISANKEAELNRGMLVYWSSWSLVWKSPSIPYVKKFCPEVEGLKLLSLLKKGVHSWVNKIRLKIKVIVLHYIGFHTFLFKTKGSRLANQAIVGLIFFKSRILHTQF